MIKVEAVLQQLTTIQATQATHTTMLKNLCVGTIEIKAALQHLTKQVADLNRKLGVQTTLPPPLLSSTPPTAPTSMSSTVAGYTSSAPHPPKFYAPPLASAVAVVAAPPSPTSPPPPPLPPANSSPSSQYPIFVPMQNSVHYQSKAYYSAAALHKALSATLALNSKWHIEQKGIVAQDLFVEMHKVKLEWFDASGVFAEMCKWKYESKRLVFDPGGKNEVEILFAPTYDLEDKVSFKASDMFTAGTDTANIVIEWAMAELINNPSILKRAQTEMDRVIGTGRRLQESDIVNLPYLQAICKEALRLHPSTPLSIPHFSFDECTNVEGYYIPKNTRLLVNIWAIGRDPNIWKNPVQFDPDRFLDIGDQRSDFDYIPFGAGRRVCVGKQAGIVFVQYIVGTLVQLFDWKLPDGKVRLNMDEMPGLVIPMADPVVALVHPRLDSSAYVI